MASARRRRTFELVALYVMLAAGWAALAHRVAGAPAPPRPDGSHLALWWDSTGAVLIACLLHLGIVLALRRWDSQLAEGRSPADSPPDRLVNRMLILVSFLFLAVTVQTGAVHDYLFDLQIWAEIRKGHDPWFLVTGIYGQYSLNAYGPLFNLLAGLAWVHPLAPKLLFAWTYCLIACWLTHEFRADGESATSRHSD